MNTTKASFSPETTALFDIYTAALDKERLTNGQSDEDGAIAARAATDAALTAFTSARDAEVAGMSVGVRGAKGFTSARDVASIAAKDERDRAAFLQGQKCFGSF